MDTLLTSLLDNLRVSLDHALIDTKAGPACAVPIVPGVAAIADWCSCGDTGCGMGWVRLDRVFPSGQAFPSPDPRPSCGTVLAAVIELGTYRCNPSPDNEGNPPSVADQTQAALVTASDAMAIVCAFNIPAVTKRPHVLGTWMPRDGGDCQGGAMTATVQLLRR